MAALRSQYRARCCSNGQAQGYPEEPRSQGESFRERRMEAELFQKIVAKYASGEGHG